MASSLVSEFKKFAVRGNVVDLAVGVVIGGAFGKIVTSLVDHVIMPPIGYITGGIDFSRFRIVLRPTIDKQPEVAIQLGVFINTVVQFLIIAFTIFLLVRAMNTLRLREEATAPAPKPSPEATLLAEIRDLLKAPPPGSL